MNINPDTTVLDSALDQIAQISQYVPEPQSYIEKRKLLFDIREAANSALLAFAPIESEAIIAAATEKQG